ncbi:hypothetical protein [Rhizobium leguminosarum]|uniref:hypothetical protein n=1 Tax=Rhizobium leguminosarum TaxID=384 RepID=UPI001C952D1F|nr:hypothetical protein [Rhizobium leguminosarum]MBY5406301.1 hypothetical protein [Rhizobium leguminosarum]
MSFLALPWVIGPIPIVVTVWAAYACGIAVATKTPTSGDAFLGALLLPSGLTAIACQLVLSNQNIAILLVGSQIISSLCWFIVMHVSGFRFTPIANLETSNESHPGSLRFFVISLSSYIIVNVVVWKFTGSDRCNIGKCFVYEWALGRKDRVFAGLYLGISFGALVLIGIFAFLFRAFLKFYATTFPK